MFSFKVLFGIQCLMYQATASCPEGWKMFASSDSKCYKASTSADRLKFQDAIEKCQSLNAKLAEPMTEDENKNLATNFNANIRYWIGISDQETEGTFKYVSDASEVAFTSWRAGQPNNRWPKLDCTAFRNGKWNTANCDTREFPYICQMSIITQCPSGDCGCDDSDMACKFAELKARLEELEGKLDDTRTQFDQAEVEIQINKEKVNENGARIYSNIEKLGRNEARIDST